jgi:hypothetical protein
MVCRKILKRLSEFIDEALDPNTALQVSQHLDCCESCRKEYESLTNIQQKLRSISIIQPPKYLRNLVQIRLTARHEPWQTRLRNTLERRWSIIRTTEGIYYWTKALGTALTTVFFLLICTLATPYYMNINANSDANATILLSPEYRQRVVIDVKKKFGMESQQSQVQIPGRTDPAIHPQYLRNLGKSVSESGHDDTTSVVAVVDPDGAAKTQDVLEYPSDQMLLSSLNEMIATARWRPASKNGQAVPSHMVLMFSTIFVHN